MIHIQKITLRNFKSFRKADIPLSIGFTAIVGSNGSGKSNILDAFLFVFGINSLKALRASRMTDLVNNQAKDDYAKVEVTLEDDVTKKEYIISRTIDTAGKSVMRLNDKRVTLNEVASLLEELGIKPFGHNIVVQGDVTRIIEMNAVQRREMIDEVAGIREFDEKKEEAHKELGNVEQKIKEVRIVISERSTQLEQLAADRQAALRHNELQEELKKTKATLFRAEVARLSDELSKNAEKKARLEDERQKKESRLSESRTELREAEAQIEQANAELVAASEKTFSEVGIRIEEKKSERRVGQERMANRRQGMEAVDSRIKTLRERLEKIAHELVAKGKLFDQKNVQAKDLEERIRQKQSQLENARTAVTGKARELKSLEDAVLEAEETATEVTRAYFEHNSALDTTRRTLEMRRGHLNEVQSELSQAQARLEGLLEKQRTLQELLSRHPKPTEQHHQLLHKIEDAVRSISYAESGLDSAKKSIQALEKSAANCPVCETKLSAKQKTDVLSAKKSEEHRNALTVKEATELRNRLLEEKKTLETVMAKQAELERFLSPLAEVQAKADQLRQRVAALVSGLDESKTRELETRMQEAKKRMEDAQDDVEEARGAVAEFRKLSDFEAVGRLSDEIQSLSKELNAALGARKELELQTQMVLVDEKEAASREIERLEKERSESEQRLENEMADGKRIDEALSALEVELLRAQEGNRALAEKKEKIAKRQLELKERIDRDYAAIRDFERKMSELEIENGKLGVRKADVEEEALSFAEHPTFESFDIKQLKERLPQIEREMQHLGSINQKALDNFGEYEREMLSIKQKADKLEEERLAVMDMIQKIEDRRSQVFLDCFNEINSNFKEMHRVLGEGEGKLELENPDKPLEGGLLLEASLRGKEIHNIDSMSGGEKTLTALAFLFAIQLFDEAPFYIFDEADAALDKENSAKLARIIARISEKNQFIGITHNDTIVKQSHQIIGVALNEQKSSVVGLRLRETQAAA